jgi:hypothetical protein
MFYSVSTYNNLGFLWLNFYILSSFSLGVKRPGREADHSPPSSSEVKKCVELYLHSQYAFMAWCLVKYREFTLPLEVFRAVIAQSV